MNLIQGNIQAVLPNKRKRTLGGWVSFNAPCCIQRGEGADTKQRGGVLFENDGFVYHCFNCGFKAGWTPGKPLSKNSKLLMQYLGLPDDEINRCVLEALREKDQIRPAEKLLVFDLKDEQLPAGSMLITDLVNSDFVDNDFANTVAYIYNRGFTLDDFDWYWSDEPGYKERVIIPFYQDNVLVGWTARKTSNGIPKYLTKTQAGYVFNIDHQTQERKFVIVVEGQFDAIAVDGVAIMHNDPSDVQCARINRLEKEVILVPDRDAAGAKMLEAAKLHNWNVSLPPWGDDIKDVADAVAKYGKVYVLQSILHYRAKGNVRIELLKKKLEKITK
jgi:hypothetical protein